MNVYSGPLHFCGRRTNVCAAFLPLFTSVPLFYFIFISFILYSSRSSSTGSSPSAARRFRHLFHSQLTLYRNVHCNIYFHNKIPICSSGSQKCRGPAQISFLVFWLYTCNIHLSLIQCIRVALKRAVFSEKSSFSRFTCCCRPQPSESQSSSAATPPGC
jgi:hypothetical protein